MPIDLKDPWKDGRSVAVLDKLCALRPCLRVGEDKGTYTPGQGYTHYHKNPKLVCMTRHCNGCPHPLPEPDYESARCCPAPDFPMQKAGARPQWQKCRLCGTKFDDGPVLAFVKRLPKLPHMKCKHTGLEKRDTADGPAWKCQDCQRWWDHEPKEFEIGEQVEDYHKRKLEEWRKKFGYEVKEKKVGGEEGLRDQVRVREDAVSEPTDRPGLQTDAPSSGVVPPSG